MESKRKYLSDDHHRLVILQSLARLESDRTNLEILVAAQGEDVSVDGKPVMDAINEINSYIANIESKYAEVLKQGE